jgi:chromosomal replication initiation ATPase DnaA
VGKQLVLDLPLRPAMGRDDFLVAPSNAAAVALIDQWPRWPSYGAILLGPHGSGKSHLATVWQQKTGARVTEAPALQERDVPAVLTNKSLVIENLSARPLDEAALFHLLNLAKGEGASVLFTTTQPIAALALRLPDLLSRLSALPIAAIAPPDDSLLRGVLVKHFSDRQIAVDEALVSYLLARMPRSLEMARQVVAAIDAAALEHKTEVTRAFAGKVLARLIEPELG